MKEKPIKIKKLLCVAAALILSALAVFAVFSVSGYAAEDSEGSDGKNRVFDPFANGASYSFVLYNNTNGLPTSEANALTQTGDGFIWIGSYGGLVRYDGSRFERMDPSMGISGVVCLLADSRDRLWVGSNDSGLAMLCRGEVKHWGLEDGLSSLFINSIIEDNSGNIFIATKKGVLLIDEEMKLRPLTDERIKDKNVSGMIMDSDGLIYCLTRDKELFLMKDGKIVRYYSADSIPVPDIHCLLPDKDRSGHVYLGTDNSGIFYCDLSDTPTVEKTYTEDYITVTESLTYINGKVWACASDNVVVLENGKLKALEGLPMNNKVNSIMSDYEGNLWLTSNRQGVLKITPNRFTDLYYEYQLPSAVVNTTCMYDGKLFIGTDTGLTVIDESGVLDSLPLKEETALYGSYYNDLIDILKNERIRSLIKDRHDRLWICTWREFGLLCYDHGTVKAYGTHNGLNSFNTRAACETKDGSVVIATNNGVNVIKDGKIVKSFDKTDGLENTVILTVAEGADGEILAGSDGGGIYAIGKSGVETIRIKDGLSSDTVLRLKRDHKRDIIWIISSNSISYMTPEHKITKIKNFPYTNNFDFVQNSSDEMWILSSNGIYVVPTEELLENGDISPAHYSISNGLSCTATANSYSGLDDNGDFYLSGNTGVVRMNIESGFDAASNYKASVPYIEADDVILFPDEDGNFTIASDVRTLTVNPVVFNYSLMTPQVSYCLEGFSDKYTTVSRDELVPIDYTNLRGGEYRFVMKITDLRTKEEKTVSVKITKKKAFYERLWFYIVAGAVIVLLLIVFSRIVYLRKIAAMKKKHKEEIEKERIITELDTAGRIQEGMLPSIFPPFPDRTEFDLYASMDPAKEVGGDFYDFFMVDDDHLCLVIADVSGKGIPAALVMMSMMIVIRNYAKMGKSPAEILSGANEQLYANNREEMFVTAWLGILEISTGKLTSGNAGHEYPAFRKPDGRFELLKEKHGFVLGGMDGIKYREHELTLAPGSKLFVYTDGVPEASDSAEELFGTERMLDALNVDPSVSPEEILRNVRKAVDGFVKEAEQFDDLTMLCLEYKGVDAERKDSPNDADDTEKA